MSGDPSRIRTLRVDDHPPCGAFLVRRPVHLALPAGNA